jgi:hypothetical protein
MNFRITGLCTSCHRVGDEALRKAPFSGTGSIDNVLDKVIKNEVVCLERSIVVYRKGDEQEENGKVGGAIIIHQGVLCFYLFNSTPLDPSLINQITIASYANYIV